MTCARKILLSAAAGGAIALAALAATPAAAFDPIYNDGRRPYFGDYYGPGPYGYPSYGYGYALGWGPDYETGSVLIPVCPVGYRLGPRGRLCWPD
ncbi:MAG: hypothetical protein KGM15_08795 [Pseudomonadota bacterium]|nr:hypothetical protein [Pseudomonadota bacterium]